MAISNEGGWTPVIGKRAKRSVPQHLRSVLEYLLM